MRGCPIFLLILLAFPVRAQTDFTDTLHTSLDVGFLQEGHYILQIITNDRILTGAFLKR